jgi:hypothetical protein
MDLRRLDPSRTGVGRLQAPTYETPMLTAAARPHVFWVGEDQKRVRSWPIGSALLTTLGDINAEVEEALAGERARLRTQGYPDDLPLPALWWTPAPVAAAAQEKPRLAAVAR